MTDQKVAVVTGVSSGIGAETVRELARAGYRVFGTVRSPTGAVPPGVERVTLDIRDQSSIDAAVAAILSRAGRIDVLVNNAGGSIVGAIEETDTEQAQALFDVNFFGSVRMTKAVMPTMRARRSGRILFVSSVVGFIPAPFMGFYAASKHALEGYSESLDHEVRPLGIRAILIQPSFIKTKIGQNSVQAARRIEDYSAARTRAESGINAAIEHADEPIQVARTIVKALRAPRPHLRYQAGKGAGTLATLRSLMPESLFDRSLRKEFKLDA